MVYLDSNIVIYVIEKHPVFGPPARVRLRSLLSSKTKVLVSDLTRLECRSLPLSRQDAVILRRYDRFFARVVSQIVSLSSEVCDLATEIRAVSGFRTVDSLHLAAAIHAGCHTFMTNDVRLKRCAQIPVEILS